MLRETGSAQCIRVPQHLDPELIPGISSYFAEPRRAPCGAGPVQHLTASLKEGIVKDMEGELQQAVNKEVERSVKGELERVHEEVKVTIKGRVRHAHRIW